jgi:hypothetical protein
MTRLTLLALAACTADSPAPTPLPPPGTRTITGAATFVTVDEAGTATSFPLDLHETIVSAQFPDGDGWTSVDGISHADGTFAIDGGIDGDYWLEVYDVITGQRQFLWTNANTLAFEERGTGRGDAVAAGAGSTLTFAMTGLDPVQADDGLELASGNLGLSADVFGALTPGATTLAVTRSWAGQPLISAAKSDSLVLAQVRSAVEPASGIAYRSAVKSATFGAIEQVDGADTRVAGAFVSPPALTYELRWQRSQFVAASAAVHPTRIGPLAQASFVLRAMPGGTTSGTSPFAALVLDVDPAALTAPDDLAQPFAIANPYPASWLFADYVMQFPVTLPVPGVSASVADVAVMEVTTNELPSAEHPVVPLVTPPRAPQIDGRDLFADETAVGETPVLSWSAPAVGQPSAYVVALRRWDVQFQQASLADAGTLIVPGDVTSVRIPAHVLDAGAQYLVHIAAISQQGQDVRVNSLYTAAIPFGYAELVTNTFSP